ncbi:hypothetical protein N22_044 [Idiomarinaceae phage 1N2-2]|uniref:hypothetical protein n=1 Tax=Idiomarinaceae phage 1N2-2 TaxID=1536592 RepID=UPI0004F8C3F0|nr:hypothetical protein N22_044 [Idiomarinaceae phage 1N2-2]AIM40746.1 hypothetical protein N22_044 [Idiomarinaceae phage 1N2-2]
MNNTHRTNILSGAPADATHAEVFDNGHTVEAIGYLKKLDGGWMEMHRDEWLSINSDRIGCYESIHCLDDLRAIVRLNHEVKEK